MGNLVITDQGQSKLATALVSTNKVRIKYFKVSSDNIVLDPTLTDLPTHWIQKDIAGWLIVDNNTLLITCVVEPNEAIDTGVTVGLYDADNTLIAISKPSSPVNPNTRQIFYLELIFDNIADAVDFSLLPWNENEIALLIADLSATVSNEITEIYSRLLSCRDDIDTLRNQLTTVINNSDADTVKGKSLSINPVPDTIPLRDVNGNVKTQPASETDDAVPLGQADGRYVNETGDTMTGSLNFDATGNYGPNGYTINMGSDIHIGFNTDSVYIVNDESNTRFTLSNPVTLENGTTGYNLNLGTSLLLNNNTSNLNIYFDSTAANLSTNLSAIKLVSDNNSTTKGVLAVSPSMLQYYLTGTPVVYSYTKYDSANNRFVIGGNTGVLKLSSDASSLSGLSIEYDTFTFTNGSPTNPSSFILTVPEPVNNTYSITMSSPYTNNVLNLNFDSVKKNGYEILTELDRIIHYIQGSLGGGSGSIYIPVTGTWLFFIVGTGSCGANGARWRVFFDGVLVADLYVGDWPDGSAPVTHVIVGRYNAGHTISVTSSCIGMQYYKAIRIQD